jgi:SAM-dependent methyltransferase
MDPSPAFLDQASTRLTSPLFSFRIGDAVHLPHADDTFDVVASALVLTFVPDPLAGVREMVRVAKPQAIVASYVWDYAGEMQMMRRFWDVAVDLLPSARASHEGLRFALARPEELTALFEAAGLSDIETAPLQIDTVFSDFDDYWEPFLGGQGPAPGYVASLDAADRERLRAALKESLPTAEDGSISLVARAWGVKGIAP